MGHHVSVDPRTVKKTMKETKKIGPYIRPIRPVS